MPLPSDDTAAGASDKATPPRRGLSGRRLTVRADADQRIGTGHVMRCLAFAAGWVAAGGTARIACTALPDAIAARYARAGAAVDRRAAWTAADLLAGSDAVMLDLPDGADGLGGRGATVILVDDLADRPDYPCDILLNQNLHAEPSMYRGRTSARLCLGPQWCLLRPEFAAARGTPRTVPDQIARLLVLMGGADPRRHSERLLAAAAMAGATLAVRPEIVLVVGAANPATADLRRMAAEPSTHATVLHDVRDMASLIASADLAVSAAGSTALELAALGTPMLLGAQNRSEIGPAAALARHGAAVDLGPLDRLDPEVLTAAIVALANDRHRRGRMSDAGRRLVDGRGVERLLALVEDALSEINR